MGPDVIDMSSDPAAEIIGAIAELDTYPEQSNKRKRSSSVGEIVPGYIEWGQNDAPPTTKTYFHDA